MNDNIWHSKDEMPPIDTPLIVWFNYKGFPNNPEITSFGHSDWHYNKNNVEKWIELDDLLKQSEELERYKKALDIAKLFIGASQTDTYDQYIRRVETGQAERNDLTIESGFATKRLKEIDDIINGTDKNE